MPCETSCPSRLSLQTNEAKHHLFFAVSFFTDLSFRLLILAEWNHTYKKTFCIVFRTASCQIRSETLMCPLHRLQVVVVDWISSSPNYICGFRAHFGDTSVVGGSRAVLDILEVTGRVCGRAGCLHEKHFFDQNRREQL